MAADLEIRIGAELTEIKGALASLRRDLTNAGRAADQAGSRQAFRGVQSGAQAALAQVRNLVGAFAALGGAIAIIRQADELTTLSARLRLVTKDAEEFAAVQERVFDLAQRSRAPLSATVDLYARIANSTKDAGVGQETLLQVVETINQSVALSGAGAQAAEAALVQLGQGLGSGTLRGEELNSVLEQTPALADAIAKGLGITRGELRKYGEEGKITSQAVINALLSQRDAVASQFAQLPVTVGQATTQVGNSLQRLLGVFNETTGATGGLASVLSDFAAYLASDEVTGAVVEFAATWGNALRQIVDDFGEAVAIIRQNTGDIVGTGEDAVSLLTRAFRELPVNLRTSIQLATIAVASGFDRIVAAATFAKEALAAVFNDDSIEAAARRYEQRLRIIQEAARSSADDALRERDEALNSAKQARDEAVRTRERARTTQLGTSRGTFKTSPNNAAQKEADQLRKAQIDAEEKLLKDAQQRELQILQDSYDDKLISAANYFATRQRLEIEALDQQIAVERQRAAAGGVERVKAEAEIASLEARKTEIVRQGARARAEAERSIARELEQVEIQRLENQGQAGEAARLRLEAQYRDLIARLKAEGKTESVAIIESLINTGASQAQFQEIQRQFDETLARLRARQQSIADQQKTGGISTDTAQEQTRLVNQEELARLQGLQTQLAALAADPNALPGVKRGAEEAAAAIRQLSIDSATGLDAAAISLRASLANMEASFAQAATSQGVDALAGLFTDLASGTKSAGDALKDFVRGFVQSMAQIAARALATYLVLQLLDAIYPGLGKAAAAGMSAGVKHSGGVVGQGGTVRRVNPMLFAGAPRYHSGGVVGLKPDERPAILQTGEEVLARNDPRNVMNGGGGQGSQGQGVRVVNVLDPSLVSGYLESAAGERAVLNVIGKNPGQVRQLVGA